MSRRINVMLCHPLDEARFQSWPKPVIVQPKLDGIRCLARIRGEQVELLSSEGNRIAVVPHIEDKLLELTTLFTGPDGFATLDGELVVQGAPFERVASLVKRDYMHADYMTVSFAVFDLVLPAMTQLARLRHLVESVPFNAGIVYAVRNDLVLTLADLYVRMNSYVEAGFEGIIMRRIDGLYEAKRSTCIMKAKPSKTDSYRIVDFVEEISIHGKPKNALGALVLSSQVGERFQVGSGLTRKQREALWSERHSLVGKIAVVKYQALTSERAVPRFPVLIEIKEKGGEL